MTARFEVASVIAGAPQRFYKEDGDSGPVELPRMPGLLKANAGNGLFAGLSPATREAIEQAKSTRNANIYLLASPEFMRR
jgi:hypothetical protein